MKNSMRLLDLYLKFIFKVKYFPVQPSKRVRNSIIFSGDYMYEIKSKVPEENVIKFKKFLRFQHIIDQLQSQK